MRKIWSRTVLTPLLITIGSILVLFTGYVLLEEYLLADLSLRTIFLLHLVRGVSTALIVGLIVIFYFTLDDEFSFRFSPDEEREEYDPLARHEGHVGWFCRLRWLAVLVVFGLLQFSHYAGLHTSENLLPIYYLLIGLIFSNVVYHLWSTWSTNYRLQLITQMILDLGFLTLMLHFSGGLENPLFLVYLFHVILGAIMFRAQVAWLFTGLTVILVTGLGFGEYLGVFPHHHMGVISSLDPVKGGPQASPGFWYVFGMVGSFLAVLICTTLFVRMLTRQLRNREQALERTAREARAGQRRMKEIVNAAGVGMVLINNDCQVEWFNSFLQDWFGWDEDVIGQTCPFGKPCPLKAKDRGGQRQCVPKNTIHEGNTNRHEFAWTDSEGNERNYYVTTSPIKNGDEVLEAVQIIQDITDRKRMQAEMNHAGKMKLLGRLSAGIAHEIGNPLNSLKTRLHRLRSREDPDFCQENLDFIDGQLDRINEIVQGISQFSRRGESEWSLVQLNEIVRESLEIVQMDKGSSEVEFITDLEESLPETAGVYNQLQQVCLNLLLNAAEALETEGSTVWIRTQRRRNTLVLVVEDDGPGVPENQRQKVFEAFHSTKSDGTGLGLAICESIVETHDGDIQLEESSRGGARFVVEIPRRETTAPPGETSNLIGELGTELNSVSENITTPDPEDFNGS